MSPTILELHRLLLQAEAYAEQLRQVEEKICKYYPEFKKRRMGNECCNTEYPQVNTELN
jgi:hypothetical protein